MKMTTRTAAAILSCLLATVVASGCSTTQVTADGRPAGLPKLAKPERILVYQFASSTADRSGSDGDDGYASPSTPPTSEQLEAGRQLGAEVAKRLVDEINDMGLTAVVGNGAPGPRVGDIVIKGHFESIDEGSAVKRMAIGFGSGKAELNTVVVGYVMTEQGLKRVGGGSIDSGGGKGPGLFVPIAVTVATANPIGLIVGGAAKIEGEASGRTTIEGAGKRTADAIAERMQKRFEQEGWI